MEVADLVSYIVHHEIQSLYLDRESRHHLAFEVLFGNPARGAFETIDIIFGPVFTG